MITKPSVSPFVSSFILREVTIKTETKFWGRVIIDWDPVCVIRLFYTFDLGKGYGEYHSCLFTFTESTG